MALLPIISGAASILGGVFGNLFSGGEREKAEKALAEAESYIKELNLPLDQARPIILEKLKSVGVWKPELEQHIDAGISKVSQIQEDPSLRQKQKAMLESLQGIADTGMTATGRAEFNKARAMAQQDQQAKIQQVLQQAQMRGQAGSGAELAAQLSSAQAGAQGEAEAADRIAAQQEQAKMAAIGQLSQAAGALRGQDFNVEQTKAGAADAFKMFDVQNQMAQQARNVASKNEALKYDVMNQQRLSDSNIGMSNQELQRQRQAEQTDFNNKVMMAQLKAGAAGQRAQQHQQNAQNTAQGWSNIGQGVAAGLGAVANYQQNQNNWNKLLTRFPASTQAQSTPAQSTPAQLPSSQEMYDEMTGNKYKINKTAPVGDYSKV